jgi:hypothetical protein
MNLGGGRPLATIFFREHPPHQEEILLATSASPAVCPFSASPHLYLPPHLTSAYTQSWLVFFRSCIDSAHLQSLHFNNNSMVKPELETANNIKEPVIKTEESDHHKYYCHYARNNNLRLLKVPAHIAFFHRQINGDVFYDHSGSWA